jgi:hypothetical protein
VVQPYLLRASRSPASVRPYATISEADGVMLANENVESIATMSADKASHWDMLHAGWNVGRVNHR